MNKERITTADRIEMDLRSQNRRMRDALNVIKVNSEFVIANSTDEGLKTISKFNLAIALDGGAQ